MQLLFHVTICFLIHLNKHMITLKVLKLLTGGFFCLLMACFVYFDSPFPVSYLL